MGVTRRDELKQVEKQTRKSQPELDKCQEIPDCVQYLWRWFWEINDSRTSNGFGFNPISYLEIEAWDRLTMKWVSPWETETIKKMDTVFREFQADNSSKKADKK